MCVHIVHIIIVMTLFHKEEQTKFLRGNQFLGGQMPPYRPPPHPEINPACLQWTNQTAVFAMNIWLYTITESCVVYTPVDMNIPSLANSVTAILCLCIHCWIPVRVIEHYSVCTRQVNSQSSTPSGQNEAKYSVITIKSIHQSLQEWQSITEL